MSHEIKMGFGELRSWHQIKHKNHCLGLSLLIIIVISCITDGRAVEFTDKKRRKKGTSYLPHSPLMASILFQHVKIQMYICGIAMVMKSLDFTKQKSLGLGSALQPMHLLAYLRVA